MVDDPELLELVEVVRELLSEYEFPGDDTHDQRLCVKRPGAHAGRGELAGQVCKPILELMDTLDTYIPTPRERLPTCLS